MKKPAIERLEDFDPYKEFLKRRPVVEKFLKDLDKTVLVATCPAPRESIIALLITFMEWQEKKEEKS